jgi:hypothetical protein
LRSLERKSGSVTANRNGVEHQCKMAEARKTYGGGRPRKQQAE